ncbi:PREDICTED: uncharacterized protein LOC104753537 [Camelina sativa]|uniref:Uncharacterized protein LOC104753537 n=1 Tax=Camelina sativa TaxID=90675 RepID=A0ABM0WPB0_CAMSA|nr:PREDICTED: uncharacterized protein LOC104753537 [Camelina sativa]
MRWHAEHSTQEGEITHPSDAKAWKHFQSVYPDFAQECRNVYLGLCTNGFSPFGMSERQYSLWPVILTPYNLPPDMCMQSEFPFLSILVPGPKCSDVRFVEKRNFNMWAVLMWTISDFSAYGMLFGWTTHGRLSCPYCMDRREAFRLKYGRKPCWFDCHRRFLPLHHPYRKNKKLFRKNKVVRVPPPTYVSGNDLFEQIDYYGAQETCKRGETIIHQQTCQMDMEALTIGTNRGKTKDSRRSRLDLAEMCAMIGLHLTRDGKLPVPQFRLSAEAKKVLFEWVKSEVKFPDGFVSKFSRCVEQGQKFSGMKSYDCHVFMQRLLPFVFLEVLPTHVHEVIADVMEHFPIHLPHEADLGGPVQFCWMYPFERFMKSLKRKAKNLARVKGSIVAGSLTVETSHFTSYYFSPTVRTKKTRTRRYDDGGGAPTYNVPDVPDIFAQIGRLAGKLFDMQIREAYPNLEESDYEACKERDFANWLKYYVQNGCGNEPLPLWLHELVQEPRAKITTALVYFTRSYTFHMYAHGSRKATTNYGIYVQAGDSDFYDVLQQILEVDYLGLLNLRCVRFKCNWYDPSARGLQVNNWGVVDVNANRSYPKFDPFILASEAQQVNFLPYPRLRPRLEMWLSVIKVNPRGRIIGLVDDQVVLQQERVGEISIPNMSTEDVIHIDPQNKQIEDVDDVSEEEGELDEFEEFDDGEDSNDDNIISSSSENESD